VKDAPSIHPSAVVAPDARIGPGVMIGPNAVIFGRVAIHAGAKISSGCIIGEWPEHREIGQRPEDYTDPNESWVVIGKDVTLRENVVVQRGLPVSYEQKRVWGTSIEEGAYIMHGAHVAHDCHVGPFATLSPYTVLGGHTLVQEGANLGIHSATHQFSTVGAYAMVGMGAMVVQDVRPFEKVVGVPAKPIGENPLGMKLLEKTRRRIQQDQPGIIFPAQAEEFVEAARRGIEIVFDSISLRPRKR